MSHYNSFVRRESCFFTFLLTLINGNAIVSLRTNMTGAEQRPSGHTPGDPMPPSDPAREAFTAAMGNYQELLAEVGVVDFAMLGMKPGLRIGFIFNVLTEDFAPDQMQQDPRLAKLNEGATTMIAQSYDYIPLRIANVTSSQAAEIKRQYEDNGVTIDLAPVRTSEVTFTEAPTGERAQDVLIGGLRSADGIIQAAAEIAAGIEHDFGDDDRASVERTFGFSILDRIEVERASTILKDIAFARNARWGDAHLARGFELMAEPSRVLGEIVTNVYDEDLVASITELDVRAAIESGALATDFSVPAPKTA